MRRAAAALVLGSLLLAAPAAGVQPGAAPLPSESDLAATPDVPAGSGRIRGRIVHPSDPGGASGLTVVLYSLTPSGDPGLRTSVSDAHGGFVFDGIAPDPAIVYLVGTRSQEIPYGVRVAFEPGSEERVIEIPISDPTPDATDVSVVLSQIRIERGCDGWVVSESHELHNPGDLTVFVAEDGRASHPAPFATGIPAEARRFQLPSGGFESGLSLEGSRVVFWGPLRPGARTLEFQYVLPAGAASAQWTLESGTRQLRVDRPDGTEQRGRAAPGSAIELALGVHEAISHASALSLTSAQLLMELDDAALEVEEQIVIQVTGTAPVLAIDGSPLVCLSLPPGIEGLQFSQEALALGLSPDPSGALALKGPFPPGPSQLALSYRIPVRDPQVLLERRFPLALPRLSVFVADTGLLAESERLHRRRPVASGTRTYLHLEGFALEPGENVSLSLAPLRRGRPLPRLAAAGLVAAAAVLALGFLASPLRTAGAEPGAEESAAERAAREREALYEAIHDLDDDLEAGKVSNEDHAALREALRARAVALLREERAPAPATPAANACSECGRPRDPDARFCAHCGARFSDPPAGVG
jgi:hypothetical protein